MTFFNYHQKKKHLSSRWFSWVTVALVVVIPISSNAQTAEEKTTAKTPESLLLDMTSYLRFAQSFSFTAEITRDDVLSTGQKVEKGAIAKFKIHRPNKLQAIYDGYRRDVNFYYDGTNFTMVEPEKNIYGVIPVNSDLNTLFSTIKDDYGFSVPMGDLISTDIYRRIVEQIESSRNLGLVKVGDVSCYHLIFSLESTDLQLWVAEGKQPLPCKFVITYKEETNAPQYSAILKDWNFSEIKPDDSSFTVQIPPNSVKVDFIPNSKIKDEEP